MATFFGHRNKIGQGYRTNSAPRIPPYADIGIDVDSVSRFSAAAGIDVDSESQIPPSAVVDVDSVSWCSAAAGIDVDVVVLHLFLGFPFREIHHRNHRRSHHRIRRL
jgi:hypothetical protein